MIWIIKGIIQKSANLKQNTNEPNLENSTMNQERIKFENIDIDQDYTEEFSKKIEESLTKLESFANTIKDKEEYLKSDEEILKTIRLLELDNSFQLDKINETISESSMIIIIKKSVLLKI